MAWLQLILALAVITAAAHALVRGASRIALRLGVSPFFVGLTLVGFGTSCPELAVSLVASLRGSGDVSVGNVIGSNIFNVAVILGISALIHPIKVQLVMVRRDLLVAVGAAAVPLICLLFDRMLPRALGAVFLLLLVVYLVTAYRASKRAGSGPTPLGADDMLVVVGPPRRPTRVWDKTPADWVFAAGGLALLVVGSRLFVTAALTLARLAGVSELVIGLTVVAVGTSLPELVTSIVAGVRGNPDIAVGNIIGSNIFNILGILGLSALVRPQVVASLVLAVDIPVMIIATLALVPLIRSQGEISRWEGTFLVAGYGVYLASLLMRGG